MALLTNRSGGQVHAEGDALETLKRNGWVEVVEKKPATSPAPVKTEEKTPQKRTRRTTKK